MVEICGRCGINNVRFTNITIEREDKGWCLSTSGGGPQIGQPCDRDVTNVIIENMTAENTGDDPIAFFNVRGLIRNSHIRGSLFSPV